MEIAICKVPNRYDAFANIEKSMQKSQSQSWKSIDVNSSANKKIGLRIYELILLTVPYVGVR